MAKSVNKERATAAVIRDGPGVLLGFMISHTQTTAQAVKFYDNASGATGTLIMGINVAPEQSPCYIRFPRNDAISFANGLSATYTNCELFVWSVQFE